MVVIDKPPGLTSHAVVGRVRRLVGTRKVGHAGTLDPMATGVLVVGINRATRLLGYLSMGDKAYTATVRLGLATVTDDADGPVVSAPGAWLEALGSQRLEEALTGLRGEIAQVPSAVSAIKVGGVRSYARVRAGDEVTLPARRVRVTRLACLSRRALVVEQTPVVDLEIEVECSTGTYVRALARDLGRALGTGGHLTALRRTRVGPFGLSEAQGVDGGLEITPMAAVAARCFPTLTLDDRPAALVRHGRRLAELDLPGSPAALLSRSGEFLALYRAEGDQAVPEAVFVAGERA